MSSRGSKLRKWFYRALCLSLSIVATSCNQPSAPQPVSSIELRGLAWQSDGKAIYTVEDTRPPTLIKYDSTGSEIKSWTLPIVASFGELWSTVGDSAILLSASNIAGSSSGLGMFRFDEQTYTQLSSLSVIAQSKDLGSLLLTRGSQSSDTSFRMPFSLLHLSADQLSSSSSWMDQCPTPTAAAWVSNTSFAYLRYNETQQLVDLVLMDTNLIALDSFAVNSYTGLNSGSIFHIPGKFLFAGYDGLLSLDSQTRTFSQIADDYIYYGNGGVSSDGSFAVYQTAVAGDMVVVNTKTGARKLLASNVNYLSISPENTRVAYIDRSNPLNYSLKVIPVAAP